MSHTPGPWREGNTVGAVVADADVEGGPLGYDAFQYYGGNLIAESVAPCNQPLIAAAPEMLAALRQITEYDNCDVCPMCSHHMHRGDCSLVALIAKAEGGAA